MQRFIAPAGVLALLFGCSVTPEPLTSAQQSAQAESDRQAIHATTYLPDGPVGLHQAMARAVAYNLNNRVSELESEIADAELEQSQYDLLPAFDARSGRDYQNQVTSRTDDTNTRTASAGFAWNALDLGVSYARAQQQANQVLVARERQRKAVNDILRDVRVAYYRAASADHLLRRSAELSSQIQQALARSERLQRSGDRSARETVAYRRALLESMRSAIAFRAEASVAKARLGELLNIPPGRDFALAQPVSMNRMPAVPHDVETLERMALFRRAEVRIEQYEARTDYWRSRELLYSLLPGVDLDIAANYSSDQFLVTNNWASTGARLGMNLFKLFAIPGRLEAEEKTKQLGERRRLALSAAILAQMHIAYRDYGEAMLRYAISRRLGDTDREMTRLANVESDIIDGGYLETIAAAARELQSGLEEHRAFIDVVRAHTELLHATGSGDTVADAADEGLERITARIRVAYADWEQPLAADDSIAEAPIQRLIDAIWREREPAESELIVERPAPPMERSRRGAVATKTPPVPAVKPVTAPVALLAPVPPPPAHKPAPRQAATTLATPGVIVDYTALSARPDGAMLSLRTADPHLLLGASD
ncbi:MAG: TolC family protein [Alphaproteobacteria bacterium]